jgi:hypothetical protein
MDDYSENRVSREGAKKSYFHCWLCLTEAWTTTLKIALTPRRKDAKKGKNLAALRLGVPFSSFVVLPSMLPILKREHAASLRYGRTFSR